MASIREQIVQAAVSALRVGSNPPATVFRSRTEPLQDSAHLPAFIVHPVRQEASGDTGRDLKIFHLTLRVECLVTGAPPADELLDPLIVYAARTLMTDGALPQAMDIEEAQIVWALESDFQEIAGAAVDFTITYEVLRGDPTAQ